jgi:hypothetical protein
MLRACKPSHHAASQLILHNSRLPSLIVAPHFDKWPHLTRFLNMKEPPGETPSVSSYFYFFFLSLFLSLFCCPAHNDGDKSSNQLVASLE